MIDKTRGSTTVAIDDIHAKGVGNLTTISNNPSVGHDRSRARRHVLLKQQEHKRP
jgi:acyl CoA:acetate/3-ketoacid CoA transferase alpha subunit